MKIGRTFYAAVIKNSGEIVSDCEGYIMSESRKVVQSELKFWVPILKLNLSDVEIKKVRIVLYEDE